MARVSPFVLAPPIVFAGLVALFLVGMRREDPNALPSVRVGQEAPPMVLTALGTEPVFDAEVLRKPGIKLVNFWASWCAPCRAEHPNLERLADEGIPIFGINYKDDPVKALAFLEELGNPYMGIGADTPGRTGIDWGLYGVPETFVIDGNGVVVFRLPGPITQRTLEGQVRPAIESAK